MELLKAHLTLYKENNMKISSDIYQIIGDYQNNGMSLGYMDDLISAQIKIAYELGKASKS